MRPAASKQNKFKFLVTHPHSIIKISNRIVILWRELCVWPPSTIIISQRNEIDIITSCVVYSTRVIHNIHHLDGWNQLKNFDFRWCFMVMNVHLYSRIIVEWFSNFNNLPLVMETQRKCSLFCLDILLLSWTIIECPFRNQYHHLENVPIESLVMSHNFLIPFERRPIRIRPIQLLQYNVLLPSYYLYIIEKQFI